MAAFATPFPSPHSKFRRHVPRRKAAKRAQVCTASLRGRPIRTPTAPPPVQSLPSPLPRPIRISPRYTAESAQFSTVASTLTPSVFWRFLLLSDGHIIQHLVTLTGGQIRLTLLGTSFSPETGTVQRRIALLGADGDALLYATTAWDYDMYMRLIAGRERTPLWEVFRTNRLACGREICAVHFGTCASLEGYFDVPRGSGMWARDYVFTKKARPIVSVHEVFSPRLAACLGPVIPPEGVVCAAETEEERKGWRRGGATWREAEDAIGE